MRSFVTLSFSTWAVASTACWSGQTVLRPAAYNVNSRKGGYADHATPAATHTTAKRRKKRLSFTGLLYHPQRFPNLPCDLSSVPHAHDVETRAPAALLPRIRIFDHKGPLYAELSSC